MGWWLFENGGGWGGGGGCMQLVHYRPCLCFWFSNTTVPEMAVGCITRDLLPEEKMTD